MRFIKLKKQIKDKLKHNLFVYRNVYRYRRWRLDSRIQKEQERYLNIAIANAISPEIETPASVFLRLRERIAIRRLVWPPNVENRPLHILYASVPGNWERHNIPPELKKIGRASFFFLDEQGIDLKQSWDVIRSQVDNLLPEYVRRLHARHPVDMLISYLSGSQVSSHTVEHIGQMGIPTFSFHWDDRRAFWGEKIGNQWSGPAAVCKAYDLNLTNATASLVKYRCEGANVLFWPEGANPDFFKPLDIPFQYDVTFCGQRYGQRPLLVDYLRRRGIRVDCFGRDWEHGYQTDEELVKVFNQSRINLGFDFVNESTDQCLKGRDFEIPACGALYLTSHNRDLERVYKIGEEVVSYVDHEDCYKKIVSLLSDPARCEYIRAAARKAVVERHTWSVRIKQLLDATGVPLSQMAETGITV
jgi:glycosyltransferase involved in cell wall biosynthesis